jgi:hypothetical protein
MNELNRAVALGHLEATRPNKPLAHWPTPLNRRVKQRTPGMALAVWKATGR